MRNKTLLSCLLTGCLLLAGCHRGHHPTEEEALAKYRPRADALTEKLRAIAAALPQQVDPQSPPPVSKPDPPMSLQFQKPEKNTSIIAELQLLDIQSTPPFEAWSGDDLVYLLRTMDSTKSTPSSELQGEPDSIAQDGERILATKYLVIWRVADYTPAIPIDPNNIDAGYNHGSATVDVFVVGLDSSQVIDSFSIPVATPKNLEFQYSKNDSSDEVVRKMEAEAKRSMQNVAGDALMQALKDRLSCKTL